MWGVHILVSIQLFCECATPSEYLSSNPPRSIRRPPPGVSRKMVTKAPPFIMQNLFGVIARIEKINRRKKQRARRKKRKRERKESTLSLFLPFLSPSPSLPPSSVCLSHPPSLGPFSFLFPSLRLTVSLSFIFLTSYFLSLSP